MVVEDEVAEESLDHPSSQLTRRPLRRLSTASEPDRPNGKGGALSKPSNTASRRRPKSNQLDPRHSLPANDNNQPQNPATPPSTHFKIMSSSKRKTKSTVIELYDTDDDVVVLGAPSELDISSFDAGQTRVKGGGNTVMRPQSPTEASTIEFITKDVTEDDMLYNDNARPSAITECLTSEDEVIPIKCQSVAVPNPPSPDPMSKPQVQGVIKSKFKLPTTLPSSASSRLSRTLSPPSLDDQPSSRSCLCGHPNQAPKKRGFNYMCMDHERWIPRKQLAVYADQNKTGRKACWTAPKFRTCVCGYPDEPEEPCKKNWLCQEHRRWVPKNRLAIVEDWA